MIAFTLFWVGFAVFVGFCIARVSSLCERKIEKGKYDENKAGSVDGEI